MNIKENIKPVSLGFVIGAAALAIAGFSGAGWMTGTSAERMASDRAEQQVAEVLVPICVEQSKQDLRADVTMAKFVDANSFDQRKILIEAGWATMPGSSTPNEDIVRACAEALDSANS